MKSGCCGKYFLQGDIDAIGGRAVDGIDIVLDLVDAQGVVQGQGHADGAFFTVGSHDPDAVFFFQLGFQGSDPLGIETIIVGQ